MNIFEVEGGNRGKQRTQLADAILGIANRGLGYCDPEFLLVAQKLNEVRNILAMQGPVEQ